MPLSSVWISVTPGTLKGTPGVTELTSFLFSMA